MRSIFLVALTASLLLSITIQAQENWPRFRGANANGVAEDNPALPEVWGKENNVQWVTNIPGLGWSSPIVWGDRVFVTSVYSDKEQEKPKEGYLMPFLKSDCNILYVLSFRPKARLCRAEAEESISIASPKAYQKVKLIYWKRH